MSSKSIGEKLIKPFGKWRVFVATIMILLLGSVYPMPWPLEAMLSDSDAKIQTPGSQKASVNEQNSIAPSDNSPRGWDYLSVEDILEYTINQEKHNTTVEGPEQNPDAQKPDNTKDAARLKEPVLEVIRANPGAGKRVALTFDDGPYAQLTEKYLEVLESYDVKATFFLVGSRVEKFLDSAKAIAEKGFEAGGHSYSHSYIKNKSLEHIKQDFLMNNEIIERITGKKVEFFRPPYGAYNKKLLQIAMEFGQISVTWNVDPKDWAGIDAQEISRRVLNNVSDGAIILLHEGRENTLAALPMIIEGLIDKGYEIVPLSELLSFESV
jgi:peptidoglycan/xylan/chitin deacetylase (PgdA/CDA1 family)